MDYLKEAQELRRKAWEDIMKGPEFRAFSAADRMVADLGGDSALAAILPLMPTGTYCRAHKTWHAKAPEKGAPSADILASSSFHSAGRAREGLAPSALSKGVLAKLPPQNVRSPSQADAAEIALTLRGQPLNLVRLFEAAQELGAEIGGSDPLATFRSSLSKDSRFTSLRTNAGYFWWLSGRPAPRKWSEALGISSNDASDPSNREGGGH